MSTNLANPKEVKEQQERLKLRQAQDNIDMKAVLEAPFGRRLLTRVIRMAGILTRSYTGSSETFFREGRRSVGLEVLEAIRTVDAKAHAEILSKSIEEDL